MSLVPQSWGWLFFFFNVIKIWFKAPWQFWHSGESTAAAFGTICISHAKWNVWGVHWCKEIKNKLSHMLKCMCSQNWWLDHTTPTPSNVICDLLLCNKLPYHVILAGRSNHACKKQSNYSPLLYQKLSSNRTSSLYTMQQHIYCKILAWISRFLTMSSH